MIPFYRGILSINKVFASTNKVFVNVNKRNFSSSVLDPLMYARSTLNFSRVQCGDGKIVDIRRLVPINKSDTENVPFIALCDKFLAQEEIDELKRDIYRIYDIRRNSHFKLDYAPDQNLNAKYKLRYLDHVRIKSILKLRNKIKTFTEFPILNIKSKLYENTGNFRPIVPHYDNSKWTIIIYLDLIINHCKFLGETKFYNLNEHGINILPIPGKMLWFRNSLYMDDKIGCSSMQIDNRLTHSAESIGSGKKLIIQIQH